MIRPRHAVAFALLVALGCHREAELSTPVEQPLPATEGSLAAETRELALRYQLALQAFNHGAYEDAASLFSQVLLEVPQDSSGDGLRHLLIQHIGWSLLGAYDMHGAPESLDAGEQMLERYLVKHEELLPDAVAEREAIYELLGEYQIRRDGQSPPSAHDRLEALVEQTKTGFEEQLAAGQRKVFDDGPVRVIEVDKINWATLDDPQVWQFFAHDASRLGAWNFDYAADLYNPTRVLVRGWVHHAGLDPTGRKQSYALVRAARPELERCYEQALVDGAELVERVDLDIAGQAGAPAEVDLDDAHDLGPGATSCVRSAMRSAAARVGAQAEAYEAKLSLTFFVQFENRGPGRADEQFGGDYAFGAEPLDPDKGKPLR